MFKHTQVQRIVQSKKIFIKFREEITKIERQFGESITKTINDLSSVLMSSFHRFNLHTLDELLKPKLILHIYYT